MKKTQPCSSLLGFKLGYNGYVFDPKDWVYSEFPTRLSTCYGKYREKQYGSMSTERILGLFRTFCPHEIVWRTKVDRLVISTVSNSEAPRDWMTENLKGYYRDLNWGAETSDGKQLGMWRSCVRFQFEEDALFFKLTWVDG